MCSPESTAPRHGRTRRQAQAGALLIELMVGLSIGAIAIGSAIASLLLARDATSTVNESSQLQQQAAHALRVLGQQIRPAGSLELQASRLEATGAEPLLFQFVAMPSGFTDSAVVVRGEAGSLHDGLDVARLAPPLVPSQRHDCLGQLAEPGEHMDANFHVDAKGSLRCKSSSGQTQPLVAGVAGFRVRYRVQGGDGVRSLHATEMQQAALWSAVTALEVCLDLRGEEWAAAYDGHYDDCNGRRAATGGRLHLVSRKIFALRARHGA